MSEDLPKEVLVVEDEPMVRMAAADALVDRGIMAWEAANASEALHALEEHPRIGVVFTDINMPGLKNGLDLADSVCRSHPGIQIIITSGKFATAPEGMPASAAFLPKPYHIDDLVRLVVSRTS